MAEIRKEDLNLNLPKEHSSVDVSEKHEVKTLAHPAKVHKKSLWQRFVDSIIVTDADTVKEYVMREVIVPGVKDLLSDVLKDAIDITFNGTDSKRKSGNQQQTHFTSYSSMYGGTRWNSEDRYSREEPQQQRSMDINDIVVPTRQDIEFILNEMQHQIDRYGQVSEMTLYDIIGATAPFTANRYGWLTINGAGCRRVRDGYLLILPPKILLEN